MMKLPVLLALCWAVTSMSIVTNKPERPAENVSIQAGRPGNLLANEGSGGLAQPYLKVEPRGDGLDYDSRMRMDAFYAALVEQLSPAPIRYDCFFVTTAHLLGESTTDLSRRIGIPVPQPGPPSAGGGIGAPEMIQALGRLGWVSKVWRAGRSGGKAGGPIRGPRVTGVMEQFAHGMFQGMDQQDKPDKVGVAYRRPNGSGHVVVCDKPGTPFRRYIDYQASSKGVDVASDVANSRIFAIFGIPRKANGGPVAMDIDHQGPVPMEVDQPESVPMEVDRLV